MTTYNVSFPGLGINNLKLTEVAFSIGSFSIYWYGIIIAAGFALAVLYCFPRVKQYNIRIENFIDCVTVGLICGIIGARLYYVVFKWDFYSKNLADIFKIHEGGLAIYGGIIGALIGGLAVAKIKKMNIPAVLDLAVIGFLIGQGVGRWGNFINQEAFGTETTLPWGMISENTEGIAVHPCFLYESLWCLLGVLVLHLFTKKFKKYDGQIFILYLIWYGFERMIVEGLRTDSLYLFNTNIRVSQLLAFLTMLVGISLLLYFKIKPPVKFLKAKASSSILSKTDITNNDNQPSKSNCKNTDIKENSEYSQTERE